MTTRDKLLKRIACDLQSLCAELDDKYDSNSGGCFYIAACIARHCKKHNIKYKVRIWYDTKDPEFVNEYSEYHCSIVMGGIDTNPDRTEQALHCTKRFVPYTLPSLLEDAKMCMEYSAYFKRSNKSKLKKEIDKIWQTYESVL